MITSIFIWMAMAPKRNSPLSSSYQIIKLTGVPFNWLQKYNNQ